MANAARVANAAKKSPRDRKNPLGHELYLERNKARNAKRGKQVWAGMDWKRV